MNRVGSTISACRRPAWACVLLLASGVGFAAEPPVESAFERDIAPILAAKCHKCHGPQTQKAALNLSTPAGIRQGGESGNLLNAEHPTEGTLYEYLHEGLMPPEDAEPLADDERAKLLKWIETGAALGDPSPTAQPALSQHDVLPILLLRCVNCHGRQRREGELDVRSVESLLKGGKSGPAIVAGQPDESLLVKKIRAAEMPPLKKLASYSVKPVTDPELKAIADWIAAGAPEVTIAPDVATTEPDPLVSDEDREFWSFQPPRRPALPPVQARDRMRNPIDAFILEHLEARGLSLSPEADRATLIRRVTFDLTGLPPEPEMVEAFVHDGSADAYERLVDRLLASPRYGERWGQYWLDLAGYCDSEGVTNADDVRPDAWRYRDYVIRAFNADKPYDRFLHEQLAGDELADYERAAEITPELYDNLVATGFMRLTPDGTYAPITGFVPDRLEVIDDALEVFSSAVLGLTIKCARCHSHKFDPLPQRDYYRLAATFKPALDEHDWLAPRTGGPSQPSDATTCHLPHVPAAEVAAWKAAGGDPKQQPLIRASWDRGEPSPTYILRRGDYLTRGQLVGPGVPSVLTDGRTPFEVTPPWPEASKTGSRLALARWLTRPDHPLTARVMVNRVWKHHFGEGIVKTLDDFGRAGAKPSHPKLLDFLATWFVEHGWSVKQLHRLVLTSGTYCQSSQVTPDHARLDPDNALWSRMPLVRMSGEVLHDSLLYLAGRLDLAPFGPPDALEARGDGLITVKGDQQRWRRSIYVLKRRTQPLTILQSFDVAGMNPNCVSRTESIVAPQALHLSNGAWAKMLAAGMAERVWNDAPVDAARQIELTYQLAVGRHPSEQERWLARESLEKLTAAWLATPEKGAAPDAAWAHRKALENFCHALFNSAAFLYID